MYNIPVAVAELQTQAGEENAEDAEEEYEKAHEVPERALGPVRVPQGGRHQVAQRPVTQAHGLTRLLQTLQQNKKNEQMEF